MNVFDFYVYISLTDAAVSRESSFFLNNRTFYCSLLFLDIQIRNSAVAQHKGTRGPLILMLMAAQLMSC